MDDTTAQQFYVDLSLYSKKMFNKCEIKNVVNLIMYSGTIDLYCVDCKRESTFTAERYDCGLGGYINKQIVDGIDSVNAQFNAIISQGYIHRVFTCVRNDTHSVEFSFLVTANSITKIGQYPSLADLTNMESKKYRNILDKKYGEFHRAIGLFTHGIGIGSFVYLRRIFEGLISEAHDEAVSENGWDEAAYTRAKVPERIKMLELFLPKTLVENKNIYSILSKGIHELDEEECLQYFPVIRTGIELILDEKIAKKEKTAKIKDMEKNLNSISSKLKPKSDEVDLQ